MYEQITTPNNMVNKRWLFGLTLFFNLLPIYTWALSSDIEQAVNIESDTAEFNQELGTANYQGSVIVQQGSLSINAQDLNITAPNNELQTIVSKGNPTTFQQTMDDGKQANGKASAMTYHVTQKKITLNGDAELKIGQDVISSNYIEYFVENGELRAGNKNTSQKGQRVKAVFHPTNKN